MDLIIILAVVGGLCWIFARIEGQTAARSGQGTAQPAHRQQDAATREREEKVERRLLNIAGTEQWELRAGLNFVKAFAIQPRLVSDITRKVGPSSFQSLPTSLQDTLKVLYKDGCLHGLEIVQFIFHGAELPSGQALYFALENPVNRPAQVIGFIARDSH